VSSAEQCAFSCSFLDISTLADYPPLTLQRLPRGAAKIVTFGPDLKPLLAHGAVVSDWSATPSVSEDYRAARDNIRKRLETLLKDFKK
jgi:hypothetical protein